MRIHPEGHRILILSFTFLLAIGLLFARLTPSIWYLWAGAFLILFLLILQFFRVKMRAVGGLADYQVIAPADGKVVVIEEVEESEFFKDKRLQISIFMSIFNMHVNTCPVEGKLSFSKYHPGKYLAAWHPKSSTENERTSLVFENDHGQVLVRQIAGAVARRIRNFLQEGQAVNKGQEMGFIRFGSRVDVLLPLDAKVQVAIGQSVKFNQTVLAELSIEEA